MMKGGQAVGPRVWHVPLGGVLGVRRCEARADVRGLRACASSLRLQGGQRVALCRLRRRSPRCQPPRRPPPPRPRVRLLPRGRGRRDRLVAVAAPRAREARVLAGRRVLGFYGLQFYRGHRSGAPGYGVSQKMPVFGDDMAGGGVGRDSVVPCREQLAPKGHMMQCFGFIV